MIVNKVCVVKELRHSTASLKHEAFQWRRPCISELCLMIMKARMFQTHTHTFDVI